MDSELRLQLEQRQQFRMIKRNEARDQVRKISCPECEAPVGEPCLGLHGAPRISNHSARVDAAEAAGLFKRTNGWVKRPPRRSA